MNCFMKGAVTCSVCLLMFALLLISTAIARGAFERKPSAQARQVDELFNRNCARCHGADGRGDTPSGHLFKSPDFTDAEWWKKNSDTSSVRDLRSIVTRGKGSMPGFGKKLTASQIKLLVGRVRSFRKSERKS